MTVTLRPTDWRDLRVIHKNRSKGVYLDTASVLTEGSVEALGGTSSAVCYKVWISYTDLDGNPRFVDDPATPDTGLTDAEAAERREQGLGNSAPPATPGGY